MIYIWHIRTIWGLPYFRMTELQCFSIKIFISVFWIIRTKNLIKLNDRIFFYFNLNNEHAYKTRVSTTKMMMLTTYLFKNKILNSVSVYAYLIHPLGIHSICLSVSNRLSISVCHFLFLLSFFLVDFIFA